jgi:hypothetical protein
MREEMKAEKLKLLPYGRDRRLLLWREGNPAKTRFVENYARLYILPRNQHAAVSV